MRLRRKPWVTEAIKKYGEFVFVEPDGETVKGKWDTVFARKAPLFVELGSGKGKFISELAAAHPDINFVGIEAQQDVLYYAAQKVAEKELGNVRLLVFDINTILDVFECHEVQQVYINFCDPWPKARHAKRRLTHRRFLEKYRTILVPGGRLCFKTDNRELFDFSLEEFRDFGLETVNVTYDLHNSSMADNVLTEYETKFSAKGVKINRCEVIF